MRRCRISATCTWLRQQKCNRYQPRRNLSPSHSGNPAPGDRFVGMAVDGRPADCVKLALTELIPQPVDLCISGMNAGANVGINVIYSGTVAAAREAAFSGVPTIAVSLHRGQLAGNRLVACSQPRQVHYRPCAQGAIYRTQCCEYERAHSR